MGSDLIRRIQATVDAEPGISRRVLSRRVCEGQDWRAPNGRLQEMSCREALVELDRCRAVTRRPPRDKDLPPVRLWAVYAREEAPPPGVKSPIEWMLLTTVDTATFDEACERIAGYTRRGGIEIYHRTLKSGCRIDDRRLGDILTGFRLANSLHPLGSSP